MPNFLIHDFTGARYHQATPPYLSREEVTRMIVAQIPKLCCPEPVADDLQSAGTIP
jgi:hypothetical protein